MSPRRRTSLLVVTLVSTIAVCWIARIAWDRSTSFLAATWQSELERVPEREVDDLVERIRNLGDEAIPALAAALASRRDCVSRAAAKAIRRELDHWRSLPTLVRSTRRRQLAETLVEAWPRLEGPPQLVAAEVLGELVSWKVPGDSRQDAQLLAACAEVLRSAPAPHPIPIRGQEPAAITPPSPVPSAPMATSDESLKTPPRVHAADSPRSLDQAEVTAGSAGPAPLPPGASLARPLSPAGSAANAGDAAKSGLSAAGSAAANEPRRLPDIRHASLDDPSEPQASAADTLEPAELSRLVEQLNDADPRRETAARKRLGDLGWSAKEIEVAKRLRHPDAAVRKALARSLPDVVGMDAAPWLLELSRDADPDIRLEAMTLLATTGDPALVETVRKLAATDPDKRIQKLSTRLAQANSSLGKEHSK